MSNSLSQNFIQNRQQNIPLHHYSRGQAGMAVTTILDAETPRVSYLGIAVKRSSNGRAEYLALATPNSISVISAVEENRRALMAYDRPFEELLGGVSGTLVGFEMERLAILLSYNLNIPVQGIDLSTLFGPKKKRPSEVVAERVFTGVNSFGLESLWMSDSATNREVCLRAWISACVAENSVPMLDNASKVNTNFLNAKELACLGKILQHTHLLEDAKPRETPNEFSQSIMHHDGTLSLQNARYRTRVRPSKQTTIVMMNEHGDEFIGSARGAKGKTTNIRFTGKTLSGALQSVRVIGRQELTNPEKARDQLILDILQGKTTLRNSLFIRKLWFPSSRDRLASLAPYQELSFPGLNASQVKVASAMISPSALVVVHGPPGTGKTTTIGAATAVWHEFGNPSWIIAHSNVAVKNMAETLYKKEIDFKILVSKEFHLEWHEHIYHMIENKLIRSDDLANLKGVVAVERLLGGSCIILSTLSMLSNPVLDQAGIFRVVPVEHLVVDEASQIKVEDFLPVFKNFEKTLRKVCFFGDPKQLAPYGQDNVPNLQTIFDIDYLHDSAEFLDTQYRMPVSLGHFISRHVYQGKLKSHHPNQNLSCVSFVNASSEQTKSGFSWRNDGEVQVMVHLVQKYYKDKDFCIITPYDAQRAAIERQLKDDGLPWERVFNVDSFQGNEADFVLVSVTRSGNDAGFLRSVNRMNVMLTRCRQGLVIVTSRSFINNGGRCTLLGALETYWVTTRGESTWVDWRLIAEGKGDLPGALGPNREYRPPSGYTSRIVGGRPPHLLTPMPQKRFDTRSLFLPRTTSGSANMMAVSENHVASGKIPPNHGYPRDEDGWQTAGTKKSRNTFEPEALQARTYPMPAYSRAHNYVQHFNAPKVDYAASFPSLPMIDVRHKRPKASWVPRSPPYPPQSLVGGNHLVQRGAKATFSRNYEPNDPLRIGTSPTFAEIAKQRRPIHFQSPHFVQKTTWVQISQRYQQATQKASSAGPQRSSVWARSAK